MASRAFTTRFINTWSIWPASARTRPSPGIQFVDEFHIVADNREAQLLEIENGGIQPITSGLAIRRRLNVRSCRVRFAA